MTSHTAPSQPRRAIKVAQFGLGPIGIASLNLLLSKPWATIVGGIDIDPAKMSKSLAEVGAAAELRAQMVYPTFAALREHAQPDVIIHTAGSKLGPALEQISAIASAGVSVVSSCEELLFPWHRGREQALALDGVCRQSGARVVATGVNPGFVMDVLPICLTGVSRRVESVRVQRIVNASTRRMPLQKKIGSGLDPDEFRALFRAGKAGHAGFQESAALIAHILGWEIQELTETCDPVVADHDISTNFFTVKRGQTCGLHQTIRLVSGGRARIEMDLKMYLDAANPHDAIQIAGEPPLDVVINGGVAGDDATVAALVNAVPKVLAVPAGLKLITDLAIPSIT